MFSFLPVPFEPISITVVLGVSLVWLHGRFFSLDFVILGSCVKDSQRMLIHMNKQKETLAQEREREATTTKEKQIHKAVLVKNFYRNQTGQRKHSKN